MVSFNTEQIVKMAENSFVKKTFGGITPESAKEALVKVADGVKKMADEAVGAVQMELQAYKGKTASEMAELTSRKDAVILNQNKKLAEVSEKLSVAEMKAKSTKVGKQKTLRNGNVQTVKVNKNGARMTTETTATGDKVSVTVETLDGDVRKTKYNLVTGKPKSTYTNTNGEQLIKYDNQGRTTLQKTVNVKKGSEIKPEILSDDLVKTNGSLQTRKCTYSDGSCEVFEYDADKLMKTSGAKYNTKGNMTKAYGNWYEDGELVHASTLYNPNTGKPISSTKTLGGKFVEKKYYTEAGELYKKTTVLDSGLKKTVVAQKDKYGNVNRRNATIKYSYPKDSQIKETVVAFDDYRRPVETIKLRDGSVVNAKFNDWYEPWDVTIQHKNGEISAIKDRKEMQEYLNKIGLVEPNHAKHVHFNNSL